MHLKCGECNFKTFWVEITPTHKDFIIVVIKEMTANNQTTNQLRVILLTQELSELIGWICIWIVFWYFGVKHETEKKHEF